MSKVTAYKGHKVPEGATHYQGSGQNHYEGFFKLSDDGWLFANAGCSTWHGQKAFKRSLSSHAVPLPEEPESKEWNGEGLPPINSEVLLNYNEGYLYNAATNEPINIAADEVLIVISIGARYDNGNPVVTVMAKDSKNLQGFVTVTPESLYPVKTQEQKDREAFIEKVNCALFDDAGSVLTLQDAKAVAIKLFSVGFTEPKGEE